MTPKVQTDNPVLLAILNRSDDIRLVPNDFCERNRHNCNPRHICACETDRCRLRHADNCGSFMAFRGILARHKITVKQVGDKLEYEGNAGVSVSILRALRFNGAIDYYEEDMLEFLSPPPWETSPEAVSFDTAKLEQLPVFDTEDERAEFLELAGILESDDAARRVLRARADEKREQDRKVMQHLNATNQPLE